MDSLVAAAIHDAKNRLAALVADLEAAGGGAPSPALIRARITAAQVAGQLTQLLALYRDRQGSLRLAVDDQNLMDFLDDTLTELEDGEGPPLLRDDGPAARLGAWAFDAYLVRLVLLDALRNARRHARSRVRLSLARDGEGLRFTVADDGPGFPEAILRGEPTAMTKDSSGLGLAFARLVAERHAVPDGRRGRLELGNDDGARFSLILP